MGHGPCLRYGWFFPTARPTVCRWAPGETRSEGGYENLVAGRISTLDKKLAARRTICLRRSRNSRTPLAMKNIWRLAPRRSGRLLKTKTSPMCTRCWSLRNRQKTTESTRQSCTAGKRRRRSWPSGGGVHEGALCERDWYWLSNMALLAAESGYLQIICEQLLGCLEN